MSDDDVIDYMVMEAVALKTNAEDQEQAKREQAKADRREAAKKLAKQMAS